MIRLKTEAEFRSMQAAGKINRCVHNAVREALDIGVRTADLEEVAKGEMARLGGTSSFGRVEGFPAAICVSINEEVGHGIPGRRVIREGDVVKVDVGVEVDGLHSDCAETHIVGTVPDAVREFVDTARDALYAGIAVMDVGCHISDISATIGHVVRAKNYQVLKNAWGHGIGHELHEDPQIPNFGPPGLGPRLRPGMALAIEPVIVAGNGQTKVLGDGWTRVTTDRSFGAHFEHTLWVHPASVEILTAADPEELWRDCPFPMAVWRPIQPNGADDEGILRLAQQEMDAVLLQAWGRPVQPREVLQISGAKTAVLVDSAGCIDGFCIYVLADFSLYIHTMVLRPRWQGTGMAQWVLTVLQQIAIRSGRPVMELCVQTSNERAIKFYRKIGFRNISRPWLNTVLMQLHLPCGVINYV